MARGRGPMVPSRSTLAVVLRTHDFGEGDRIVVLVAPEAGRIEGVARGARRIKSQMGAALELLSQVRVTYRERPGRDLVSIDRVELIASSFGLLSTLEALEVFSHVAELAQAVAKPGEQSELLVRLLTSLLDAARVAHALPPPPGGDSTVNAFEILRLYFDLWVSRLEGYWPALDACAGCGRKLSGPRRVGIHTGGALCPACGAGERETSLCLSAAGVALVHLLLTVGPAAATELAITRPRHDEVLRLASALLTTHLERELRTMPSRDVRRARLAR
jgi:DNA repair protein RecO (recombination protein O)